MRPRWHTKSDRYFKMLIEQEHLKKGANRYDTPKQLGIKWQLDVKYVPTNCYSGKDNQKFYQYTVIDEASRERFIYPYMEHSSYSTIDFIKRAIVYFGYKPKIIQTDTDLNLHMVLKPIEFILLMFFVTL